MNGPQHYAEAERLAEIYKEAISNAEAMPQDTLFQSDERIVALSNARALLEKAQVHATLAQTAAVIESVASRGPGDITTRWTEVVWGPIEVSSP